jgi:quinol monooxygenase YgiN
MILEIAQIEVTPGSEAAFEAGVAKATPLFRDAPGCRSLKLHRSIEHPGRYRLVVGWDDVAAHMEGFRESDAFQQWRAIVGPYFAGPVQMEHVETVFEGF